ncbi:hypothetical protein ACFLY7_01885 [Patescibacteria group bacterium]
MINIEVSKNNNENDVSLLRRFSKKVKSSGVLPRVRSIRYKSRNESPLTKKRRVLKSIERKVERERMIKLGKIVS